MNVPLLDLRLQYEAMRGEIDAAVHEVLDSGRFILGPQVTALEREIAEFCDVPYAVGLASGTDSLLLSLRALGVGYGDAVITVPYTFFATAGVIANLGARPLFVDIESAGFNMDPEQLSSMLETECACDATTGKLIHRPSNTTIKAILPVHLYGQCAEMDAILEIARGYALPVVEDACQALGARYGNRRAGSMGNVGCFSFFPTKNLGGAGDGGMVITSDKALAERILLLRGHGAQPKYYHAIIGFNSRLDEIQAAILRVKLRYLEQWSRARLENASRYGKLFEHSGMAQGVSLPRILPGRTHIFNQYVVRAAQRDALRAHLSEQGIGTEIYYPVSLHEQECFRNLGYSQDDFPQSREAARQTLALPVFPELSVPQQEYVVASVSEFCRKGASQVV